jgi:hypothetical protein
MTPTQGTLIEQAGGDMKQIALRLPAKEFDEYAELAAAFGVSLASILRGSIRRGMPQITEKLK